MGICHGGINITCSIEGWEYRVCFLFSAKKICFFQLFSDFFPHFRDSKMAFSGFRPNFLYLFRFSMTFLVLFQLSAKSIPGPQYSHENKSMRHELPIQSCFQLSLRRHSDYYQYIYVCPAIMIAFLIPVLFILPAHDTGKLSLGRRITLYQY